MTADALKAEIDRILVGVKAQNFTGQVTVEVNFSEGGIGDVSINQGWRVKPQQPAGKDLTNQSRHG